MPVRLTLSILALASVLACSDQPIDRVCVVVNRASPVSVAIGQAYAEARGIPGDQIVELEIPVADPSLGDARHESIGRDAFEQLIRQPLERIFEERGWVERIKLAKTYSKI